MKFTPILISLFLWSTFLVNAQSENKIKKKSTASISSCDSTASIYQNKLTYFDINKTDSIQHILNKWEQGCGKVEPILRLEVLMAIHNSTFVDSNHQMYIDNYVNKYIDRITAANEPKYHLIYESQKDYYDFIPLRGEFDNWTKQIAIDLLPKQINHSSEYLLCLLLSDNIKSFNDAINTDSLSNSKIKNNFKIIDEDNASIINLNLISGVWIPLGMMSNTFYPSPQIGIKINLPIFKTFSFGIGINLQFLNNVKALDVKSNDNVLQAKGSTGLNFSAYLSKEYKLGSSLLIDGIGGVGIGRIHTTLAIPPDPTLINQKIEDQYYSIQTIDCSFGVNIKKKIFKKSTIGLNLNYNYTPFYLDSTLATSIGSNSTSIGLLYTF